MLVHHRVDLLVEQFRNLRRRNPMLDAVAHGFDNFILQVRVLLQLLDSDWLIGDIAGPNLSLWLALLVHELGQLLLRDSLYFGRQFFVHFFQVVIELLSEGLDRRRLHRARLR